MAISDIDTSLVTVGAPVEGGCVFTSFTEGVTLPERATDKLDDSFISLGELSENGVTESNSVTSTDHKGWHGKVLLTTITDEKVTFKMELVEVDRASAAKVRYGVDNVKEDADGTFSAIDVRSIPTTILPLVIDELESNGYLRRTVIPRAKIESVDDISHQRGNLMVYGITFSALDSDMGTHYVRRAKPAEQAES